MNMKDKVLDDVVYVNISALTQLKNNPRTITPEDFDWLCDSISADKTFFESRPCLVNKINDELIVYAGNQKMNAAIVLGWKKIPCVIEEISQELMEERALKDNNHAGQWDRAKLKEWDNKVLIAAKMEDFIISDEHRQAFLNPNTVLKDFGKQKTYEEELDLEEIPAEESQQRKEEEDNFNNQAQGNTTEPAEKNAELYATFNLYMLASNKNKLITFLNKVCEKYTIHKMEDALIHVIHLFESEILK